MMKPMKNEEIEVLINNNKRKPQDPLYSVISLLVNLIVVGLLIFLLVALVKGIIWLF